MAHVILTVSSFEEAAAFYGRLMPFLGARQVFRGDDFAYWVGGRTALGIQRCDKAHRGEKFVQLRVGLHHLCFRARSREDIDQAAAFLRDIGTNIVRGPLPGDWAPGYYYVLFEDPDGIGSRFAMCRAPECWLRMPRSIPEAITPNPAAR